jgi:hypothetical protein
MGQKLPTFDGGRITIILDNQSDYFLSGEIVSGTVNVDQSKSFEAS